MFWRKEALRIINLSATGQNPEFTTQGLQGNDQIKIYSHPFFAEDNERFSRYPGMAKFRKNRDESLQAHLKSEQPLIILEQVHRWEQLKTHLQRLGVTTDVYVFLTPYFDPTPIDHNYFQDKSLLRKIVNDHSPIHEPTSMIAYLKRICWGNFAAMLRSAQITFAETGGQCLAFYDEEDLGNPNYPDIKAMRAELRSPGNGKFMINRKPENTLIPEYCVGTTTIELLKRGFDVSISLPSWPNGLWRESSLLFP